MPIDYSKLRSLTGRRVIRALKKDGFYLRNQSGSHRRYVHADGRRVTIAVHKMGDTFRPKTLRSIIEEQARWTEEDLQRLKIVK